MSEIVNTDQSPLQDVKDIRRLMERSSRFTSLSGLSVIAAGVCALLASIVAWWVLDENSSLYHLDDIGYMHFKLEPLHITLLGIAVVTLIIAGLLAMYFTAQRAKKLGSSINEHSFKKVVWSFMVPFTAGGLLVAGMIMNGVWLFVAPASMVVYGLAWLNASKYTLAQVRNLAFSMIILGLINMFFIGYGLYFWALGFGLMHIIHGGLMCMSERKQIV